MHSRIINHGNQRATESGLKLGMHSEIKQIFQEKMILRAIMGKDSLERKTQDIQCLR